MQREAVDRPQENEVAGAAPSPRMPARRNRQHSGRGRPSHRGGSEWGVGASLLTIGRWSTTRLIAGKPAPTGVEGFSFAAQAVDRGDQQISTIACPSASELIAALPALPNTVCKRRLVTLPRFSIHRRPRASANTPSPRGGAPTRGSHWVVIEPCPFHATRLPCRLHAHSGLRRQIR